MLYLIFVAQDEYINDSLTGNADTVFIARTTQNTNFIVIDKFEKDGKYYVRLREI